MNQPPHFTRAQRDGQRGAALLVLMLIIFMTLSSWILSLVNTQNSRASANQATNEALAQARDVLIGRATADSNRPGSLPCPDGDDDGSADLLAGDECPSYIGRLPWKTLKSPALLDGEGNALWYVLARELRDDDSAAPINPTTALGLSLDGTANIAAVVFSAGAPLAGQSGRPSNDINDYLDGGNRSGGPYTSGPTSPTFNDRAIAVSREQLFNIISRVILGLVGTGLEQYYTANGNRYPEYNSDPDSPTDLKAVLAGHISTTTNTMLDSNGWYSVTNYTAAPDRQSAAIAIKVSPTITRTANCTIEPPSKPTCTQP